MAIALPRPSTCGARPAYLDNLFEETRAPPPRSPLPPLPPVPSLTRSAHSSNSSISSITTPSSETRYPTKALPPRLLPPAIEESTDEVRSIRSFRTAFGPRLTIRNVFKRRTYPEATEINRPPSLSSLRSVAQNQAPSRSQSHTSTASRRPPLPKLQTAFPSSSLGRKAGLVVEKPLPSTPSAAAMVPPQELSCHRCYYFAARNCNGFVMGGRHGDACELCLQAGFFGAP